MDNEKKCKKTITDIRILRARRFSIMYEIERLKDSIALAESELLSIDRKIEDLA